MDMQVMAVSAPQWRKTPDGHRSTWRLEITSQTPAAIVAEWSSVFDHSRPYAAGAVVSVELLGDGELVAVGTCRLCGVQAIVSQDDTYAGKPLAVLQAAEPTARHWYSQHLGRPGAVRQDDDTRRGR